MMRAVLVDDEPLARARLRALLSDSDAPIEVVGEAGSGREAVPLLHQLRPDVVFLDVQMPVLDGFDVLDLLGATRPHVVFVTAYDEHALHAFEVHAADYLTKPVRRERLARTLARVAALVAAGSADAPLDALVAERGEAPLRRLTLRAGRALRVVEVTNVTLFEARDKLVFARYEGRDFPIDFTLQELDSRLPPNAFVRVHRAFVVNASAMRELTPWFGGTHRLRLSDGSEIPVSRRRVRALKKGLSA
jgi:two-component system LytT family response regulator